MTDRGCKQRVLDNGDATDCGERTFAGGYCRKHGVKRRSQLAAQRNELYVALNKVTNELHELHGALIDAVIEEGRNS